MANDERAKGARSEFPSDAALQGWDGREYTVVRCSATLLLNVSSRRSNALIDRMSRKKVEDCCIRRRGEGGSSIPCEFEAR